jgi:hypothetical protein
VVVQQAGEKDLIAVLQGAEEEEALQVGGPGPVVLVASGGLLLQGGDALGQQPEQAEGAAEVKQGGEQTVTIRPRDEESEKAINLRRVNPVRAAEESRLAK